MLERASSLQEAYDQYCSPANMQSYWLSPIEWEKLTVMVNFLHPLYKATNIICGSTYPTINHSLPLYILLIKQICQVCNQYDVRSIKPASNAITNKLTKYLMILPHKTPVVCATIIDPHFKLNFFALHEATLACFGTSTNHLAEISQDEAKKHFTAPSDFPNNTQKSQWMAYLMSCTPHQL
ncbi:hypothetical protein O181_014265 [Austropuccinia psidii MF-1]|uniref:Uncharacterized protein n=1 Tax=Austropuccinia psidii MF-1 TaxID=1389203 RepID=A0A9Q3GPR5_9BASI|nr:hypothetical protein [Austropuccinia psidii MF-1]